MDSNALDPALGLSPTDDHGEGGLLALAQHHHPLPPPPPPLHLSTAADSSQHPLQQQQPDHLGQQQQQQQHGLMDRRLSPSGGGGSDLDPSGGSDAFHLFDAHAGYPDQHHLHHAPPSDHQAALDALPDPPSTSATMNSGGSGLDGNGLAGIGGVSDGSGHLGPDNSAAEGGGASTSSRAPRPPTIPIACARCRKQKLKCSGGRPCERCAKKGLAIDEPGGCEYVAEIRRRGLGKKNRKSGDGGQQSGSAEGGPTGTVSADGSSVMGQYAGADGSGNGQAALHHLGQHDWHHETYPSTPGTGSETHPSYGLHHEAVHQQVNGDVLAAHANAEAGPSNYGPGTAYSHPHAPLHQLHAHDQPSIDPALVPAPTASVSGVGDRSGSAVPAGNPGSAGRLPPPTGGPAGDALGFSPSSMQAMDLLDFAGLDSHELSLLSHTATRMPDLPAPPTPTSSSAVFSSQLSVGADNDGRSAPTGGPSLNGSTSPSRFGAGGGQPTDAKPPVPPKTPIACARCRAHKLRCPTPPPGPCERCTKAGVGAECAYAGQIRRRGESKRKRSEVGTVGPLAGPLSTSESGKRARTENDGVSGPGQEEPHEHEQAPHAESLYADAHEPPPGGAGLNESELAGHDESADIDDGVETSPNAEPAGLVER